jgi:hypothetical protein
MPRGGELRSKAEAFLRISRKPYEQAVRSIRDGQPGKSAQTIANKPTEVVFAGIQDGHIALFVRGFVADSVGNISFERLESTAPWYTRTGFFLGLNGHIRSYDDGPALKRVVLGRQRLVDRKTKLSETNRETLETQLAAE